MQKSFDPAQGAQGRGCRQARLLGGHFQPVGLVFFDRLNGFACVVAPNDQCRLEGIRFGFVSHRDSRLPREAPDQSHGGLLQPGFLVSRQRHAKRAVNSQRPLPWREFRGLRHQAIASTLRGALAPEDALNPDYSSHQQSRDCQRFHVHELH